jgi:hypothetical protein
MIFRLDCNASQGKWQTMLQIGYSLLKSRTSGIKKKIPETWAGEAAP